MRRLTIGQRNDDFFLRKLLLHIIIYTHFHLSILCFITCSDIFILFITQPYKMCFHLLSSMFTSFYGTPRPMGAKNISGHLISPHIISYILLKKYYCFSGKLLLLIIT